MLLLLVDTTRWGKAARTLKPRHHTPFSAGRKLKSYPIQDEPGACGKLEDCQRTRSREIKSGSDPSFSTSQQTIRFQGESRSQVCHWIEQVLCLQQYHQQSCGARGLKGLYLAKMTGHPSIGKDSVLIRRLRLNPWRMPVPASKSPKSTSMPVPNSRSLCRPSSQVMALVYPALSYYGFANPGQERQNGFEA